MRGPTPVTPTPVIMNNPRSGMMEVPHRSRLQAALKLVPFETAPCDPFKKANETPFPSSR
jgi:hypothetical protein